MVWVEKDVAAVAKAVFDNWDERKDELRYRHLYAMDAVRTPREICETIQKGKVPMDPVDLFPRRRRKGIQPD